MIQLYVFDTVGIHPKNAYKFRPDPGGRPELNGNVAKSGCPQPAQVKQPSVTKQPLPATISVSYKPRLGSLYNVCYAV